MSKKLYELTIPQDSIWMSEKYLGANGLSNVGGSLIYHEKVDFDLLRKAIYTFVQNNEAVRTAITFQDGVPFQYIKDFEEFNIPIIEVENDEALKTVCEKLVHQPFNIANSFLSAFHMLRFPDGTGGFYGAFHHVVADAWSMSLLISEVSNNYSYLTGKSSEKPQKKPSYTTYIESEKNYRESNKFKKDASYWESVFESQPSLVSFSNKNTPASELTAKRKEFTLDNSKEIYDFCSKNNIPTLTFFLSIFAIYLHATSSQEEIVLGSPILNRNGVSEKSTFGMFVNTLPIKLNVKNNLSFLDFAREVSAEQFAMFRHHKYSYFEILKYIREKYDFSNNLYDTIISYQNARDNSNSSDTKYTTNWDFCGYISNSLDIHIYDMDDSGILKIFYDYQIQKFSEREIQFIHRRISNIINQILENSNILLKEISLITNQEISLIDSFNDNSVPYDDSKTLIELFEKQVSKTPNKVALKFKDQEMTYEELYQNVCKLANHLRRRGVNKNSPVVLLVERSIEMVISILATLKAGGYYIAIDPFWPKKRIHYIIQNSDSKILITNEKYISNFEDYIDCVKIENLSRLKDTSILENVTEPSDLAYILYTSGSTGKPKGTLITNKNVVGLLNATHNIFKQTKNDVWTLFHTYTFDFSTWEIYGSLLYGGKLVVVPKEVTVNPKEFLQLVISEKVTILNQTPAYFYKVIEEEKLLDDTKFKLHLRYVILGGEAVQAKPLRYWKNKYPDHIIYNGYGPTETTVFAIMDEITAQDLRNNNIYIGKPIPNYKISILDEAGNIMPVGVSGEICISGVGVCDGYFKNEKLTKQKFIKDENTYFYRSGDVGYFDYNGRIKYLGRNDNQVKIRGFRIELEEIEKQIAKCKNVSKVLVVPVENANLTKSLVGFFEAKVPNIVDDVLLEIKKSLTSYMIPKLYQIDEFPVNNNGKVDVKYLLQTIENDSSNSKIVKPSNDLEKEILEIIKNITGSKRISVTDDFFEDLGFDSLNVMDLSIKLSNYQVEIQDINNFSSIQKLAEYITSHNKQDFFIDKLQENVKVVNRKFSYDIGKVLLTGVTGFLGSHLLYELLHNKKVKKIYCVIRGKQGLSYEQRFYRRIYNYFNEDEISNLVDKKVVLLKGELTKENFGLSEEQYKVLCKNVTCAIHSAANVSHYGKYEDFYPVNVEAVKAVINFCKEANCELAHISTISVGAFCHVHDLNVLTENDININQKFKNQVYMLTKYEAECEILKEVKKGFNAKIFRLGNIMPRISDSKFQVNIHQNAFLSRLKTLIDAGVTTYLLNSIKVDLSPVDLCARSILKLIENPNRQTIYHIENPNVLSIGEILNKFLINLNLVSPDVCLNKISKLNSPFSAHLTNSLSMGEFIETPTNSNLTVNYLHEIGFDWPVVNDNYLQNIYELILSM